MPTPDKDNTDILVATACSGSRNDELFELMGYNSEFDFFVNTTESDPAVLPDFHSDRDTLRVHSEVNFAKWVNAALDYAAERSRVYNHVIWINSDIKIDTASILLLQSLMRDHQVSLITPDFFGVAPTEGLIIYFDPKPHNHLIYRPAGACFMVPTYSLIRMDEDYRWHYETDDFDYQHRVDGEGSALAGIWAWQPPDTPLRGDFKIWAQEGLQRFMNKWGVIPHGSG